MLVAILAFVPLASGCSSRAAVRQQPLPEPGALVRAWYVFDSETGRRRESDEGTLIGLTSDSIVLTFGELESQRAVPLTSVSSVEVWRPNSSVGQRAIQGTLVGLVLGAVIGYAASLEDCTDFCLETELVVVILGVGGAVVGLLAGVVIGATESGGEWEGVGLDRLRMSLGPQRNGRFGFGASVRF